jgi:DNA-binding transcriptional ArsR family regulator
LAITSPEPRCGKTTLLDVIERLVPQPLSTSGLECVRLIQKPAKTPLDRLDPGTAQEIIATLTNRSPEAKPVILNPDSGWTSLQSRLADDLRRRGALLPQQLKIALLGLRSLPRMTVGAYDRAGGVPGLEATFVSLAIDAAVRMSGLSEPRILDLLLALVDEKRQPPAKGAPLMTGQIAEKMRVRPEAVRVALAALADREIVRARGEPSEPTTTWQLDHDYLARPIVWLKGERERWSDLLISRAKAFQESGNDLRRRYAASLSLREQAAIAIARLRGRLRYGEATGFVLLSLLFSVLTIGGSTLGGGGLAWAALQYDRASRLEATLAGMGLGPFLYTSVTQRERSGLLTLADASFLVRRLVTRDTFQRADNAEMFSRKPNELFRALVGLNVSRARSVVISYVARPVTPGDDPALRDAAIQLAKAGGPALGSGDAATALKPVLAAITQPNVPSFQLDALAQAYQAVAAKLPKSEAHAAEALKPVLAAITQPNVSSDQLDALARAYQAVAAKLPAATLAQNRSALRGARRAALDSNTVLDLSRTELMALPGMPLTDAERLVADLLRDPLIVGKTQDDTGEEAVARAQSEVLDAFARRLVREPEHKPERAWDHDVWAFVAWARSDRGGFDPDRLPPPD